MNIALIISVAIAIPMMSLTHPLHSPYPKVRPATVHTPSVNTKSFVGTVERLKPMTFSRYSRNRVTPKASLDISKTYRPVIEPKTLQRIIKNAKSLDEERLLETKFIAAADKWEALQNELAIAKNKIKDIRENPSKYMNEIADAESAMFAYVKTLKPAVEVEQDQANLLQASIDSFTSRLKIDADLVKSDPRYIISLLHNAKSEIERLEDLLKRNPSLQSFQSQLEAAKLVLDNYVRISRLQYDVPSFILDRQQQLMELKKHLNQMGATWDPQTIAQVKALESEKHKTAIELAKKAMNLPARKSPGEIELELQKSQLDRTLSRTDEEHALVNQMRKQMPDIAEHKPQKIDEIPADISVDRGDAILKLNKAMGINQPPAKEDLPPVVDDIDTEEARAAAIARLNKIFGSADA